MKREQFFEFLDANGINAEPGCNQRIMDLYEKITGHTTFETFNSWKSKGRKVKKGESSFPIFSRPVHVLRAEKEERPVTGQTATGKKYAIPVLQSSINRRSEA